MKKFIAMLLAIMLMLTCFTACGAKEDSDMAYVKKNGKIVVGITDYAPMDYKDENGEWTGFDAEFARLFAGHLGVDCEFFVIPNWGTKFMELETKQIDAVWNGMTITEEALTNSSVSDPYVINAQVVVMKKDALANYADAAALAGLDIAVESGSAGESCANEIEGANVVPLQNQEAALMEVAAGIVQNSDPQGISQKNVPRNVSEKNNDVPFNRRTPKLLCLNVREFSNFGVKLVG